VVHGHRRRKTHPAQRQVQLGENEAEREKRGEQGVARSNRVEPIHVLKAVLCFKRNLPIEKESKPLPKSMMLCPSAVSTEFHLQKTQKSRALLPAALPFPQANYSTL
jgi:hypothetical protein